MQKLQWIKSPDFLWQTEDHWPQQDPYENEVDHNSPDVRKLGRLGRTLGRSPDSD